jgi:serine/threonine-protein kinase RsbW
MDWLIDRGDEQATESALGSLEAHLRRHAASDAGVDQAVATLRETLAGMTAGSGLLRLHLDWRAATPRATFGEVADEEAVREAGIPVGSPVPNEQRPVLDDLTASPSAPLALGIERRVQETFEDGPPPMVAPDVDPREVGVAGVAVALMTAAETHPTSSPAQMASLAGAAMADSMVGESAPTDVPTDVQGAANLIVEAHRALGSDARVLSADDTGLQVAMSRCPFGRPVGAQRSLCHVTTGLAGRLAARVAGEATVVLDENIAAGDEECHLHVLLGPSDEDVRGEAHRWPPSSTPDSPVPHLDLSLNLPLESASVPVVRRVAAHTLRAFGVEGEDISDVELAITEACANVIDHASETDSYEVQVELAADRCAITVLDQGGGFDATAVPAEAELSAEEGRGLALMRALVDRVAFTNEPQAGAVVHMVKTLRYDATHPLWRNDG